MRTISFLVYFLLLTTARAEVFDLRALADSTTVLRNPDKGWYHHYYDNGIDKYLLRRDADL